MTTATVLRAGVCTDSAEQNFKDGRIFSWTLYESTFCSSSGVVNMFFFAVSPRCVNRKPHVPTWSAGNEVEMGNNCRLMERAFKVIWSYLTFHPSRANRLVNIFHTHVYIYRWCCQYLFEFVPLRKGSCFFFIWLNSKWLMVTADCGHRVSFTEKCAYRGWLLLYSTLQRAWLMFLVFGDLLIRRLFFWKLTWDVTFCWGQWPSWICHYRASTWFSIPVWIIMKSSHYI